jgi:hypothetical protein
MKRFAVAISSTVGLVVVSVASVAAAASPPVMVSSEPSPYAGCSIAGQPGRNYLSAEVEPQLAVNPTNSSNFIAMYHQDRWSNGGGRGITGAYSTSGGASWTQITLPFSSCAPGGASYERASDPWVSFGSDGTAYASALSFDASTARNAVTASVSTDGGATWTNTQALVAYSVPQLSTDKNSTTADPIHNGTAYTVWDTLTSPQDRPDDVLHAAAYAGPAYFSKTTDFGVHWSAPQIILNPGNRHQTIGNIVVVDRSNDALYDFTNLITSPNTPKQGTRSTSSIAFVKSTDGGSTWSSPQVIAPFNSLGVFDPNTGQPLRTGDGIEEVAIDPANGNLYVVWQASSNYQKNLHQSGSFWDDEILITVSKDGGAHWTTPGAVHKLTSGLPTYTPTVAVDSSGTVAVSYYDNRSLSSTNTTTLPTDYWVSYSTDAGASFSDEQHIAGPFDEMSAPVARGFFLGDYEGLQSTGAGLEAVFVKTNCNLNPSDPNAVPTGDSACGPASSNVNATPNTNPTDVFSSALTP